jgi:hypothetical protein
LFVDCDLAAFQNARKQKTALLLLFLPGEMVGDARFELATPWTQTKCATKLR